MVSFLAFQEVSFLLLMYFRVGADRFEQLALSIVRFPTAGGKPIAPVFPSESSLQESVSSSEILRLCIHTLCLSPEINTAGKLEIKESTWSHIEATDAFLIGRG